MRVVVQRVKEASVTVDHTVVGAIDRGLMILVGFSPEDTDKSLQYILDKVIGLRIFEDFEGKMNLSVLDVGGGILFVPNFTLYGDCRKGKRPSFIGAAEPNQARLLFEKFISMAKVAFKPVEAGIFQTDMKVSLINDGPVTIIIDSDKIL